MRTLVGCWIVAACVLGFAPDSLAQNILRVEDDHFTVNAQPRFLLFVSYFDAMRRQAGGGDIDTDLQYFKDRGFDGIRMFPNWFHYCSTAPADDGLFSTTTLHETKWGRFQAVLDRAAAKGLLVDVTFTRETITGQPNDVPFANYQAQIVDVAHRLRTLGTGYRHVMFDFNNEFDIGTRLTQAQVQAIAAAVRAEDPLRVTTASSSDAATAGQVAAATDSQAGVTVAGHHDARFSDWYTDPRVAAAVRATANGLIVRNKPIYLQEPMPFSALCGGTTRDDTPGHHRAAAAAAKRNGAAAWTFHTRVGFDLAAARYVDLASASEKSELSAIRAAVDAEITWAAHWGTSGRIWANKLDHDHDGKADRAVYRFSTAQWGILHSSNGSGPLFPWGCLPCNDRPVPADYDGDGITDVAIYRDSIGTAEDGKWYIAWSSGLGPAWLQWGAPQLKDIPIPADYDGDGKTDIAVFRQTTAEWFVHRSSDGGLTYLQWGATYGDVPIVADYDGDGKADFALYRNSALTLSGYMFLRRSSDGAFLNIGPIGAPTLGDVPVPGDYDGDGKADAAIWRPVETGGAGWYIAQSSNGQVVHAVFGGGLDFPVPADYNGDGRTDIAVWRPSDATWYVAGAVPIAYGSRTDKPVP